MTVQPVILGADGSPTRVDAIDVEFDTPAGKAMEDVKIDLEAKARFEKGKAVDQEKDYWNKFYSGFQMAVPSQFGALVATEIGQNGGATIVEFGCGNGRDSLFFGQQGYQVFAGDISKQAIEINTSKAGPNVSFAICDVADQQHVQGLMNNARAKSDNRSLYLYNRFFLHTLDDQQERLFLTALAAGAQAGDKLYMEYRCAEDAKQDHLYKGHYRRFVPTPELVAFLEGECGFQVTYQCTGQGMAKYKQEDPFVSRVIAVKL